ncbi:hypothetical protein ACFQ6S_13785 [Streptomyces sp. NPDC056479]|uniref:hypothetical protein n=1 Tax=Streptomyces sp. NPDC056479 TaxID=3345832 RepID=UPI0036A80E1C
MGDAGSEDVHDRAQRSNRLLGTTGLELREFAWTLVPPLLLLALWGLGKFLVRRGAGSVPRG